MEVIGFIMKILAAIRPSASNDPEVQLAWRQSVATVLSAIVIIGAFSVCWMRGWVPGLAGVALASDIVAARLEIKVRQDSLESGQHAVQLILIKNGIKQALKDRCHSLYARNQAAIDAANRDIDDFTDQYRALTGLEYRIPDCSVILIADAPP